MALGEAIVYSTVAKASWTLQGDGTRQQTLYTNSYGALQAVATLPEYSELARRGMVYSACNSAAITFGTALTATGVTFHLCNPIGSLFDLHVIAGGISVITSTVGGTVVWAQNAISGTAVTAGTPLTPMNRSGASGVGLAKSATTLPAAPTAMRVMAGIGVIAAAAGIQALGSDYVGGAIVVPPGGQVSLQGITVAGTGIFSMVWAEIPNA